MTGWIKLHRELIGKSIWQTSSPEQKTILITLLIMANHYEKEWEWKGKKYKAKPGQFVTSLPSIVKKCGKGITTQNVRTALARFEKYGFLTDESTNRNRLITIANWDLYQQVDEQANMQTNRQLTGNQQATNRQLTAKKECKNNKNDKNNNKPPYPLAEFAFSPEMEKQILTWLKYKKEKKDTYTETGFKTLLRKTKRNIEQHGEQAVVSLIDESMSNNWKGIIWDRLTKVKEKQSKKQLSYEGREVDDFEIPY